MKMMRFAALALFVVMMVSAMMMGVSAENKSTVAYVADVTVDGEIDDVWQYAPENKFEGLATYSAAYGNPNKSAGVDWAKCNVKFLWNGTDKLFVLLVVEDPKLEQTENIWVNVGGDHCKYLFDLSYGPNCPYPSADPYGAAAKKVTDNTVVFEFTYILPEGTTGSVTADICYTDNIGSDDYILWSSTDADISWQGHQYGTVELSTTNALPGQGGDNEGEGEGEGAPDTADFGLTVALVAVAAGAVVIGTKKRAR